MKTLEFSRAVGAAPDVAWRVVSDVVASALGRALWRPIRRRFARQCELLLDKWQEEIEARVASGAEKAAPSSSSARP